MESPDGTGHAVARRGSAAADGGLGVVDRGPPVPACQAVPWTPYRGGASTYASGASGSRSQIDDTSHAYNICSSIQLLNIDATSYDLFYNAVFLCIRSAISIGSEALCFRVVRPSVRMCVRPDGGFFRPVSCRLP